MHIAVYYDTQPYTEPQVGSPFVGGTIQVGTVGLRIGDFKIGELLEKESFPVNLLVFEVAADGRYCVKIGTPGLKIGSFQVGQEILPPNP